MKLLFNPLTPPDSGGTTCVPGACGLVCWILSNRDEFDIAHLGEDTVAGDLISSRLYEEGCGDQTDLLTGSYQVGTWSSVQAAVYHWGMPGQKLQRELNHGRTRNRNIGGTLFSGYLSGSLAHLCVAGFLLQTRITCLGMVPLEMDGILLHQLVVKSVLTDRPSGDPC